MSERNHSQSANHEVPASAAPNRKLIHLVAGTACVGLLAAVTFQFMRAESATSQTEPASQQTTEGRASVSSKEQYLGRVNKQPISYDEVARECVSRYGAEVLDKIINRMIIQQECEKRGVVVTEAEVTQEVQKICKNFKLPPDTWYQMLQAERHITPQQYHRDIIWPMLALKKLAGTDITVSEEDMRKAFERDYGPRVEVRIIMVDGNIRQAGEIWDKCRANPEDFDKLAKELSADPNSRPLGGVVPPIRKHAGLTQVEEEAFKLKPGEISSVIQIEKNRHVIMKCEGFTKPVVADIKDVWTELHETLIEEKTQMAVAEVFEKISDEAEVINYLTRKSTVGKAPAELSPGNIRQTSGTQTSERVTPAVAR
ncbi:MAG: peptidylprolyl isomerase [Planctomycetaceae bacterium]